MQTVFNCVATYATDGTSTMLAYVEYGVRRSAYVDNDLASEVNILSRVSFCSLIIEGVFSRFKIFNFCTISI